MKFKYFFPEGETQTIALIMEKIFALSPLAVAECAQIKQCLLLIIDHIRSLKALTADEEFIVEYFFSTFHSATSSYFDIKSHATIRCSEADRTSYLAAQTAFVSVYFFLALERRRRRGD